VGSEITVDVQTPPAQVGFDAARLARIDRHFATYVDDGRLPGWQIVVSRRGQIVHSSTYGMRDVQAGLPVEPDTLFRIYSMTKPITSVAAMMLYEEGAFEPAAPIGQAASGGELLATPVRHPPGRRPRGSRSCVRGRRHDSGGSAPGCSPGRLR
jgi:CubicO group peptidase (beta-lactamase class C family)